jgi:HK97 family phage portal protein
LKLADFIRSKLLGKKSIEINSEDFEEYYDEYEATKFNLTEIALFTAIDLIARSIAKCEFVTVENHKERQGYEYYTWNYAPNKHQTKIEFITEFISKLIFKNEALIFETSDGQLLVAESFSKQEYAILEDVFSGITARGLTLNRTYKSSEVIYLKYSYSGVRILLSQMCRSFENLMHSAEQRYTKAIGHKGFLKISNAAQNDIEFQEKFEDLMNKRFLEYFKKQNAVLPLYEGYEYSEPSTDAKKSTNSEINDISKLKTEVIATVGNALHIPPAIISGEASQLSDAVDTFIANSIDPLAQMLEQEITKKRYGESEFIKGNYLLIDTTYVKHIDAITSANNLDKAIACGVLNPAKAQKYCNALPSNDEWAQAYYMTKNYQTAEMTLKGGEK